VVVFAFGSNCLAHQPHIPLRKFLTYSSFRRSNSGVPDRIKFSSTWVV